MSKPVFIEPIANKDVGDCCITCLAMLTGRPYQDVIAAAPVGAEKDGMWQREVIATAAALGVVLRSRRRFDLREDDGILMLKPEPPKNPGSRWLRPDHAVLLLNGMVLDPYNGRLWLDVEVYLQQERYRIGSLLTREN